LEQNVGHYGVEMLGTKENKSLLELSQRPKYHPIFFKNIFHPFSGVRGTDRNIIIFDSGSPLSNIDSMDIIIPFPYSFSFFFFSQPYLPYLQKMSYDWLSNDFIFIFLVPPLINQYATPAGQCVHLGLTNKAPLCLHCLWYQLPV
jgi:hypothetical protein